MIPGIAAVLAGAGVAFAPLHVPPAHHAPPAHHVVHHAAVRHVIHHAPKPKPTYANTVIGHSSDVGAWISTAMKLTGVHGSDWYSGMHIIADGESGDNILVEPGQSGYTCDINCVNGTPSEGVAQTIQATFDQYHQPGTGWNMLNPVADFSASINYIKDKYGSPDNVPGVRAVRAGGHYMGY